MRSFTIGWFIVFNDVLAINIWINDLNDLIVYVYVKICRYKYYKVNNEIWALKYLTHRILDPHKKLLIFF